jgi:hypothetical protein
MKSLFMTMMMAAALFSACGHRASTEAAADADSVSVDSVKVEATDSSELKSLIDVETVKFEKNDSTAEVSVLVQWPTTGEKVIVDSLRRHICDLLGDDFIDGPKAIQKYGQALFESQQADWHSVYDDMEPDALMGAFSKTHEITMLTQTKQYVTYYYETYQYGGGAHGYMTEVGFTFRKSDGRQIPLLKNTNSPKLAKIIKEGVRRHFSERPDKPLSDDELLDFLFAEEKSDLNHLPLPGNSPYLSDTGMVFHYTQYEIAPYSSGIIKFEVPFKEILPFMTDEAQKLITE